MGAGCIKENTWPAAVSGPELRRDRHLHLPEMWKCLRGVSGVGGGANRTARANMKLKKGPCNGWAYWQRVSKFTRTSTKGAGDVTLS